VFGPLEVHGGIRTNVGAARGGGGWWWGVGRKCLLMDIGQNLQRSLRRRTSRGKGDIPLRMKDFPLDLTLLPGTGKKRQSRV